MWPRLSAHIAALMMENKKTQRLDKVLANLGIGSRKEIKQLVRQGQITVNEILAVRPEQPVCPEQDELVVNGEVIRYRSTVYFMLHKPQGFISATEDNRLPVVTDLLAEEDAVFAVFPVGRLDKDTEGLLLLTNDGVLTHRLLSPKWKVAKRYQAVIDGLVTEQDIAAFAEGVVLEDGYKTHPAVLEIAVSGPVSQIFVTITEGKFHQVKRMFEAVGKTVTYLKRLTMGPLTLDEKLELGKYRELTEKEKQQLFAAVRLSGETNK